MGNWTVVVLGTGQHHNKTEKDADVLAQEFVAKLKDAGQIIESATITHSGRENIAR